MSSLISFTAALDTTNSLTKHMIWRIWLKNSTSAGIFYIRKKESRPSFYRVTFDLPCNETLIFMRVFYYNIMKSLIMIFTLQQFKPIAIWNYQKESKHIGSIFSEQATRSEQPANFTRNSKNCYSNFNKEWLEVGLRI